MLSCVLLIDYSFAQIRLLKRQAQESKEDMEEMRRTHKDNANVSMQLLKKASGSSRLICVMDFVNSRFAANVAADL